ncbi:hypothetical protein [Sphingomonas sp. UYP23]
MTIEIITADGYRRVGTRRILGCIHAAFHDPVIGARVFAHQVAVLQCELVPDHRLAFGLAPRRERKVRCPQRPVQRLQKRKIGAARGAQAHPGRDQCRRQGRRCPARRGKGRQRRGDGFRDGCVLCIMR